MRDQEGLITKEGMVPLLGVKVDGDIMGRSARVKICQRFKNREKAPLEAIYKFPLPESAAVCGFLARVNGRNITGKVEEREKAFEIYDDAMAGGDGAFLMDEERPNIFTLSVGNLEPDAEAVIEIEYVTLLDMEGASIRFCLPTSITPRYVPERMVEQDGIPEEDRLHGPYSLAVPYGLSLSLNLHHGDALRSVESPSHPVRIETGENPVRVTLSSDETQMDRDFVLSIDLKKSLEGAAWGCRFKDESFVAVDLMLPEEEGGTKRGKDIKRGEDQEVIFLLDCSGSMDGDSIAEAIKAIEICLKGLNPGTLFNLCRFGSTFEYMFQEPRIYNADSLDGATRYLRTLTADLGGTEILTPLENICATGPAEGRERTIMLLTDGAVGNEDEVIRMVQTHQRTTRIFALGIGAGVNDHFIRGLARAGRGAAEFIFPGERVEPKVFRLFRKISDRSVGDLKIEWQADSVEVAPQEPALFLRTAQTFFARLDGSAPFDGERPNIDEVRLSGTVNGETRAWTIPIREWVSPEAELPIPTLWARERIRDLEESRAHGSRQAERRAARNRQGILEISRKYGLLSSLTSFVAVEDRMEKDKTTGRAVLRKVPILVTTGWHGLGSLSGTVGRESHFAAPSPGRLFKTLACPCPEMDSMAISEKPSSSPAYEEQDRSTDLLMEILSLQTADGGFLLNKALCKKLGFTLSKLKKTTCRIECDTKTDLQRLLCTAILFQLLEIYFADHCPTWEGVTQKSRAWYDDLTARGNPRVDGQPLAEWAAEFAHQKVRVDQ